MNPILGKRLLAPGVFLFEIEAPRLASHSKAGQFVILRPVPQSERIPLSIVDTNPAKGCITLVVQEAGRTTEILAGLQQGETVADLLGPLGQPTRVECVGHVLCVAGGIGVAGLLPVVRAMRSAGNVVTALCGARSKSHLILTEEIELAANEAAWATEDGSFGFRGNVVDLMRNWLRAQHSPPQLVHVVGPVAMMQAAAEAARQWAIPAIASLNPIMIDGIGMCGGCRVTVGGTPRFACVEGPEFDALQVDFEELARRNRTYFREEQQAWCPHRRES